VTIPNPTPEQKQRNEDQIKLLQQALNQDSRRTLISGAICR
jgi:hypothetical protein